MSYFQICLSQRARPGPLDSPGLRRFLIEQGLQKYCYISHIAINYPGDDRPKQGFQSWLEQLPFLKKFTDDHGNACVRMREPTLSGDAPRGQDALMSAFDARGDQGEGEWARPGPLDSPGLRRFLIEADLGPTTTVCFVFSSAGCGQSKFLVEVTCSRWKSL